ncbi:glycosyltransferase [Sutcliffiella rhizosphaerae]|uniref:UDP-N-acetylglucosamine--peptide N-acetylglucosaminyltransferase GtfA subunit n=1 Tax=Sutcliffiella rhizosphaerae TaxID=2880967 RepID=A0ABM8YLL8_9BACI|nr:glycosyltransferase [Sutcliffiella rhizosphaerae]CAG9620741.1 UDP-N-acetylglucosamine--peptide N-acetylglucosaminyltransferase GtfA subunit [Sutcliffiella rhizosphaerae]
MKNILIATYDLEVGGVERSLISMLDQFNYDNYKVDLMLYKHNGDFLPLLTNKVNLLKEVKQYSTFRKPIVTVLKDKHLLIASTRIIAKLHANIIGKLNRVSEPGYYQMQYMWKYVLPYLPYVEKEYDVAMSYLWPHDFVAEKVRAKKKIAWIHTDYSTIETDEKRDIYLWSKFDYIVAVSEACKVSFIRKYPTLENRVKVMENIISAELIKKLSNELVDNPLEKDTRFKIITVARLSHAKGIDNAIKALKILINKGYSNLVWYVVGYGGDEDKLKELINENQLNDHFMLLGKKVNPYPYIKAADLYVQPSRYEGKAVTVSEAQVLGKAIVITNYLTASSQLKKDIEGLICENSPTGIATEVERLYVNEKIRSNMEIENKKLIYDNAVELDNLYRLIN